jgi:hypothetical protein
MDTEFTGGRLSQSVCVRLFLMLNGGQISPIGYFGNNCKFLKGMAHNNNGGKHVS